MITKKKIIEKIEKNKEAIRNYSVERIGLFGSYLNGKETPSSDIDFLVEFKITNADNYFELWYYLEKLFKGKKIDLVIESGLKPEVKYVLEEAEYVKI